jgi:hypothetical protein
MHDFQLLWCIGRAVGAGWGASAMPGRCTTVCCGAAAGPGLSCSVQAHSTVQHDVQWLQMHSSGGIDCRRVFKTKPRLPDHAAAGQSTLASTFTQLALESVACVDMGGRVSQAGTRVCADFQTCSENSGPRPWVTKPFTVATAASTCDPHVMHKYVCAHTGVLGEQRPKRGWPRCRGITNHSIALHPGHEAYSIL